MTVSKTFRIERCEGAIEREMLRFLQNLKEAYGQFHYKQPDDADDVNKGFLLVQKRWWFSKAHFFKIRLGGTSSYLLLPTSFT